MTGLEHALAPYQGWVQPVFVYLVASLAIGTPAALVAGLLVRAWRPLDAASRYTVWYVALVVMLLGPLAPAIALRPAPVTVVKFHVAAGVPFDSALADALRSVRSSAPRRPQVGVPPFLAVGAVAAWLLIALAGSMRLGAAVVRLGQLKRDALPLPPDLRTRLPLWRSHRGRVVRLCVSDRIDVPLAVGLFDAMVLLPKRMVATFEYADVDRFVLHELEHLERRDDWTTVVQCLAQTVLFFNPAVHAVARCLDLEREIACDDRVIATTSDVRSYAAGLTRMAEAAAWPQRGVATPAIFASRRQLSLRVEELLARRRFGAHRFAFVPAAIVLAGSLGVVGGATTLGPAIDIGARNDPVGAVGDKVLLHVPATTGIVVTREHGPPPTGRPPTPETARLIVIDRTGAHAGRGAHAPTTPQLVEQLEKSIR
jgi:beta-lactamase regulating signal transducer with metallopeptidase domain